MNTTNQKRLEQLADLRTAIQLGEEIVTQMSEYDLIVLADGRIVDRTDIEAETQRVMDAVARLAFTLRVTSRHITARISRDAKE